MKKSIAVLAGDGIGPEVMLQAVRVLNKIAEKYQHTFIINEGLMGGAAYDKYQNHFPQETQIICDKSDAVLFGSVGGPVNESHLTKWNNCEKNSILALRKTLKLCANLRPVQVYPELIELCPLKKPLVRIDIMIVRELMGDIYFGEHKRWMQNGDRYAADVAQYSEQQIAAVAHCGFRLAQQRRMKLTSVDKANVLDTSRLWREIVSEIALQYPEVELVHMLVDNCAMQMIINPAQFDVILTSNLFGDILSDAAAALSGSLGLMPSASLSVDGFGLYESAGGSAPDIAGKNIANPIAQILSVALMLRYSFELYQEAAVIENAVRQTLQAGYRTKDIMTPECKVVGTTEFTDEILTAVQNCF